MAAAIAVFAAGLAVGASRAPERDVASELDTRRQLAAAKAAVEALESRVGGIEQVAAGLSAPVSVQAASVRPADVVPDVMPRVNAQFATWERRIRGDLATREDLARGLVQLKREEALSRQQIRDEFRTELNEVSRVFLSFRNAE
jgi:hypothetical protein